MGQWPGPAEAFELKLRHFRLRTVMVVSSGISSMFLLFLLLLSVRNGCLRV